MMYYFKNFKRFRNSDDNIHRKHDEILDDENMELIEMHDKGYLTEIKTLPLV